MLFCHYGSEQLARTANIPPQVTPLPLDPQKEDNPDWITKKPIIIDTICISFQDDFNKLLGLTTDDGKNIFTCEEIVSFKDYGGDFEYAKELASLKDKDGKLFFTGYDLVAFKHAGGTVEYARKFVSATNSDGRNFSGSQLPQFYKLGLDLEEIITFTDTLKPNALLIYPTHDGELGYFHKNYGAFRETASLELYQQLKNNYDLKVNVSSVEEEVYDALTVSKGFMFLMLAGHGTEKTLSLGENDLRSMNAEKDEKYTLDTSDSELEGYLQNLDPQATIFLGSCSNGKGGAGADNLANSIATWGKGRKVIAALEDLEVGKINMLIAYPFDVILQDRKGENDITYRISIGN